MAAGNMVDVLLTEAPYVDSEVLYLSLEAPIVGSVPSGHELWLVAPLAVCMLLVRVVWEACVARPMGRAHKLSETPRTKITPNAVLEQAYRDLHKVIPTDQNVLETLAARGELASTRHVERWWRQRRAAGKASALQRFCEGSWRILYYTSMFVYGVVVLHDKPWFTVTNHFWLDYPNQPVGLDLTAYYIIEMAFYLSLIFSMASDVKRKDFWEMLIHHIVTLALMGLSWTDNFVRGGSMVLVCHDAADVFMEAAKLAKYTKHHRVCDVLFMTFASVFFITRLVYYPLCIIGSAFTEGKDILQEVGRFEIYAVLLFGLLILNVIWFSIILKMVYFYVVKGQVEKDERSQSEVDSSEVEEANGTHHHTNNNIAKKEL